MRIIRKVDLVQIILTGMFFVLIYSCQKSNKNTDPSSGIISDIDGNIYHSVTIGSQVWMIENLKTTKFNDGTTIPQVNDEYLWYQLKTPGLCWYFMDTIKHKDTYGVLYNWYAVNTGKLAPKGWHIPSFDEWTALVNYEGGDSLAGAKLKEQGTSHWMSPNTDANNESGFTALPGGCFAQINYGRGYYGYWWSSSKDSGNEQTGWFWALSYDYYDVYRNLFPMYYGLTVRCVKN